MTEASEFEAAENKVVSVPCHVCTFLSGRADRAIYDIEFARPVAVRSNAAIMRVLLANGAGVSTAGVQRHRSKHV